MNFQGYKHTMRISAMTVLLAASGNLKAEEPPHLVMARKFVKKIEPNNNAYGSRPIKFVWPDESEIVENRSVCSSFCVGLLRRTYRLTQKSLIEDFGEEWPEVDDLVQGVQRSGKFELLYSIKELKPGDFILYDYQSEKKIPTGHIMLVSGSPREVSSFSPGKLPFSFAVDASSRVFKAKVVYEWQIQVIDSSNSPHGESDTRYKSENGRDDNGLGEGPTRILTDQDGIPLGYTWSNSKYSKLRLVADRAIILARWKT